MVVGLIYQEEVMVKSSDEAGMDLLEFLKIKNLADKIGDKTLIAYVSFIYDIVTNTNHWNNEEVLERARWSFREEREKITLKSFRSGYFFHWNCEFSDIIFRLQYQCYEGYAGYLHERRCLVTSASAMVSRY